LIGKALRTKSPEGRWIRTRLGTGLGSLAVLIGAVSSCSSSHEGIVSARPVTVPLASEFEIPHGGRTYNVGEPLVRVRVGNNRPVWVELDTGSIGLHVLSSAIRTDGSSGVSLTGQHETAGLADGTTYAGPVANALVHIGPISTASAIPVQLVTRLGCMSRRPHCPGFGRPHDSHIISGLMGISLRDDRGLARNPLPYLTSPYNRSWTINMYRFPRNGASGALILDASVPRYAAIFRLRSDGTAGSKVPTWQDTLPFCLRIAYRHACGPTLLDTGSDSLTVTGDPEAPVHGGTLPSGLPVSLYAPSNGLGEGMVFISGHRLDYDTVLLLRTPPGLIASGVPFFYNFRVTYDDHNGRIAVVSDRG
jgi:hypothetical protein